MKVILNGTDEQVHNLKELIKEFKSNGDTMLPDLREDYQIKYLWSTADVQDRFECTDEEALIILEKALTMPSVMEQIWFSIEYLSKNN